MKYSYRAAVPRSVPRGLGSRLTLFLFSLAFLASGCGRWEGSDNESRNIASSSEFAPSDTAATRLGELPASASNVGNSPSLTLPGYAPIPAGIPKLRQVLSTGVSVSGCCHILLYYGLGRTDLSSFASGELVLKAITDEKTAVATFGKSPFVRTRQGVRYHLSRDFIFHADVGESHRDQCLSTFALLNLPLRLPISLDSGKCSIADLLSESVANFSLDQKELPWTAIAYARYLPPKKAWENRFGESTSFSQLARNLINRDPNHESCAGAHVFQAVVCLEHVDRGQSILDQEARAQIDSFLSRVVRDAASRQQDDGSWNWQWLTSVHETVPRGAEDFTPFQKKVLVSGHVAEVLSLLAPERRPPRQVFERAGEWLTGAITSPEVTAKETWVCPLTHAARAARELSKQSMESWKF